MHRPLTFNETFSTAKIQEALKVFMILANSSVDNGQCVSFLAAATNNSTLTEDAFTTYVLNAAKYEKIASVFCQ